jgi:hypothetical protein
MIACGNVNNTMTKLFDAWFGPDEVDSFDASCNTCKHFRRRPMTPEEKSKRNIFGMPGDCQKKNIVVTGWQRGQYCGFENADCYENRRTNMRPHEACKPKEEMTP